MEAAWLYLCADVMSKRGSGSRHTHGSEPSPAHVNPADPALSVAAVIAVFNGERYIAQTLESILSQTFQPAQVIVVDDGSTDRTAEIVRRFPKPVELYSIPNQGPSSARNFGVARAESEWIALCDSDDLWLPTKIERQLRLAWEKPMVGCVITDFTELTNGLLDPRSHLSRAPVHFWECTEQCESGLLFSQKVCGVLTRFQPAITSTQMVRRQFFQQIGGCDPKADPIDEDTCLHVRCFSHAPFGVVPEVLMHYRRHPDSLSADSMKRLQSRLRVWDYMLREYPVLQPFRAELKIGLEIMRKEVTDRKVSN